MPCGRKNSLGFDYLCKKKSESLWSRRRCSKLGSIEPNSQLHWTRCHLRSYTQEVKQQLPYGKQPSNGLSKTSHEASWRKTSRRNLRR